MAQEQKPQQKHSTLSVPSHFEYVRPIQSFVGQLARQAGFAQKQVHDIELIVDEMCGNAIEHGSETPTSGIDLRVILDSSRLELLIRDKGKKKSENWLATGRLDEVAEQRTPDKARGHGVFLMKSVADHIEIQPNDLGGTDVRVVFNLSPTSGS